MKILAKNKKAYFDYEILKTFEAGLVLKGYETKAVKGGKLSLNGAFVAFAGDKPTIINMNISKYPQAGVLPDYDPTQTRELLLHKNEISYLKGKSQEKGLTIVPLMVYTNNRFIKVEIGVGRGKKNYDKREVIKKRDLDREVKRTLKNI
jgi:SsrA-binding protein